jgi:hypothetical protein
VVLAATLDPPCPLEPPLLLMDAFRTRTAGPPLHDPHPFIPPLKARPAPLIKGLPPIPSWLTVGFEGGDGPAVISPPSTGCPSWEEGGGWSPVPPPMHLAPSRLGDEDGGWSLIHPVRRPEAGVTVTRPADVSLEMLISTFSSSPSRAVARGGTDA